MFSDVLMTVDFDRTFTGPDSKIPQRNLDAVAFFMDNGGTFTINTGRSVSSFKKHLGKVPVNAPILMYNGSDLVYVTLPEDLTYNILEGDVLLVYGAYTGTYSYTTVKDVKNTVPYVNGTYVVLK